MPRKTGAQKRKAQQTSGQEGQDPVEGYLGLLRRPDEVESIRNADSIEEKMHLVGTLLRMTVKCMKTRSDEALGFLFDDVVSYYEVGISLG